MSDELPPDPFDGFDSDPLSFGEGARMGSDEPPDVVIPESTGTGQVRRYGLLPDKRNTFELQYTPPAVSLDSLPVIWDLRPKCPPIYDQGSLGSCTANAIGGLFQTLRRIEGKADWTPSRLFIYYNERAIEGSVNQDAGAAISDGFKVCSKLGCPPESEWPYVVSKFRQRPPAKVFTDAKPHIFLQPERVNNADLGAMLICIASGFPIVIGFQVYESFEWQSTAHTGNVPMPGPTEQLLGGHAVMLVGFNRTERYFILRNSWGPAWGQSGYATMPFDYILNGSLTSDCWTARLAS